MTVVSVSVVPPTTREHSVCTRIFYLRHSSPSHSPVRTTDRCGTEGASGEAVAVMLQHTICARTMSFILMDEKFKCLEDLPSHFSSAFMFYEAANSFFVVASRSVRTSRLFAVLFSGAKDVCVCSCAGLLGTVTVNGARSSANGYIE